MCYGYIGKDVLVRLCCEAADSYSPDSIARSTRRPFTALHAFVNKDAPLSFSKPVNKHAPLSFSKPVTLKFADPLRGLLFS